MVRQVSSSSEVSHFFFVYRLTAALYYASCSSSGVLVQGVFVNYTVPTAM